MNEQERVRRAEQARQIIDSPLWAEAWDAYRARLLRMIEDAPADDADGVLWAKRLMAAGLEARRYMEMLLQEGKVSAEIIKVEQERKRWWQSTGT